MWLSRLRDGLVSMRMRVGSLALLSGLRIRRCSELWCRLQMRLGYALLWLWHRPVATVPIRHLAWEPPYAAGAAQEMAKRPKKTKNEAEGRDVPRPGRFFFFFCLFAFSRAAPAAYGGSQARGQIRTTTAGLCQSHSNVGSEPHLRPIPQLTATPDPLTL